jgi:Uma2 family endonuclease
MVAKITNTQRQIAESSEFFRISVVDYHEMISAGILDAEDRCELLDGYLVKKMSQNTPHSSFVSKLVRILNRFVNDKWWVKSQLPITLSDSEPEPDVSIVRGEWNAFDNRHPGAGDFGIVIEVSDSSLSIDRQLKKLIYATEQIETYWIVNIVDKQIEVYTQPLLGEYQKKSVYRVGETCPVSLDGVIVGTIDVGQLMQ